MVSGLYTILQLNIELQERDIKRKQTDNSLRIARLEERLRKENKINSDNKQVLSYFDNEISRLLNEETKNTQSVNQEQRIVDSIQKQIRQSSQNIKFLKKTGKNKKKINKQKKQQKEVNKRLAKEQKRLSDLKKDVSKKNSEIISKIKNTYKQMTSVQVIDTELTENEINYFKGNDFYWLFKDRFNSEYKVQNSDIQKESASILALEKYLESVREYEAEEPDIFKQMVLQILVDKIEFNLQTVKENEGYDVDISTEYRNGDAKYPIFVDFIPSSSIGPLIVVDIDV